ncbi:MAG: DUF1254 domain-containing protein [Hyphomonadaceae bacterium]
MRQWLGPALLALAAALGAHFAVMASAPNVVMNTAMDRLSERGARANQWVHAPRVSEASRTIVRPSPDLAYSVCVYDVANGPVHIRMGPGAAYWSLSLYSANSDNFFTLNDREAADGADIVIVRAGAAHPVGAARVVESPSTRGIALERRLAPTQDEFLIADAARRGDVCEAVR